MKIKRFYCSFEECNKSFRSDDQLAAHLSSHSSESSVQVDRLLFECEICNSRFPTKRSVSAHKRMHQSNRKVVCCGKILKLLTDRLSGSELLEWEVPTGPYSVENAVLPVVTGRQEWQVPKILDN